MSKKKLIAGPFVGEFGWELFGWQGYLRKISQEYDDIKIISRKQNEFLYRDFYSKFLGFDPKSYNCSSYECLDFKGSILLQNSDLCDHIYFNKIGDFKRFSKIKPEYIIYGKKENEIKYDIVIHARKIEMGTRQKRDRSTNKDILQKMVDIFIKNDKKIACIGLSDYAYQLENCDIIFDKNLEYLSNIIRNSRVIIGPSSGPIHFASLCNCPQYVWCGPDDKNHRLLKRYSHEWNPFEVEVKVDECGFIFEPEKMSHKILYFINNLK